MASALIVGIYISENPRALNSGSLIAIVIGGVFGSFGAKFAASLFGSEFGKRDPMMGAIILLLLSVGYSLPLYSDAISDLASRSGLSSIKTPFLEIAMEKHQNNKLGVGGNQFNQSQIRRLGDPAPGLLWLHKDTHLDDPTSTLLADETYIKIFEADRFQQADMENTKAFLRYFETLSSCLENYVQVMPDNGLFFADLRPIMESLYEFVATAKIELRGAAPARNAAPAASFKIRIEMVMENINSRFSVPHCGPSEIIALREDPGKPDRGDGNEGPKVSYFQPYVFLVLADLLVARGSPDQAIALLTDWLDLSTTHRAEYPDWFQLRVASRISILLADLAGQNTYGYREFIASYYNRLKRYVGSSNEHISLEQLVANCESGWSKLSESDIFKQKVLYVMLETEDEVLRTEVNFVGDQSFEELEELNRRARLLVSTNRKCLSFLSERDSYGTIADHRVTAGILGLTIADRMLVLARSRGDRNRALEIANDAERDLREGHAVLSSLIKEDTSRIYNGDPWSGTGGRWSDRVFTRSNWETSYNLAARAMLQLRNKGE